MAIITKDANNTINASTAEGVLLELLMWIRISEKSTATNPNGTNNVTWAIDDSSDIISGTFNLPIQTEALATGTLYKATESLTNYTFVANTANTTSTFKAQKPNALLMEVSDYLQKLEGSTTSNPQAKNFISATIDRDLGVYSGSFKLPINLSLVAGGISIQAMEYLL